MNDSLQVVLSPTRQLWLATLGTTSVAFKATQAAWDVLVIEGASAERWLLGRSDAQTPTKH